LSSTEIPREEVMIIKYLLKNSERDIYQSQISKELNIDPRVVSKILIRLEEKGAIKREPVIYESRKTLLIKPVKEALIELMEKAGIDPYTPKEVFERIKDIPCITCPYIYKCYEGGYYDPTTCQWLSEYLSQRR